MESHAIQRILVGWTQCLPSNCESDFTFDLPRCTGVDGGGNLIECHRFIMREDKSIVDVFWSCRVKIFDFLFGEFWPE